MEALLSGQTEETHRKRAEVKETLSQDIIKKKGTVRKGN